MRTSSRLPSVSLSGARAVWHRQVTVYRRSWKVSLVPNFFEPVFYLLALGVGLGAYVTFDGGGPAASYLAFLAPGLVAAAAMNGASFETTYNVFARMHQHRSYEGMLTTPLTVDDVAAGELLWAVTRAGLYGGVFLFAVTVADLVPPGRAFLCVPVVLLTGAFFAALGLAFTARVQSINLYSYYYTMFLTPMFLFAGIFFPVGERFGTAALWVVRTLPLYHSVHLMRAAALGGGEALPLLGSALYLLVGTALLALAATAGMRRRLMR